MTTPDRTRLAKAQAELLQALLANGPAPAGFDPARLHAQSLALRAKRRRVTAALRPDLPERLGPRFRPLFDEYATTHPRHEGTGARTDANTFATWLTQSGHLPKPRRRWWPRRATTANTPYKNGQHADKA
ncbi:MULTISPECIES: hypothetical protein [unclassified Crossiella]|uniref:hypothetical protein n=1 Tax=unclassified Crossiella TaxID=2620835 RepID=UPI001FFF8274|nr:MULTISPECIES: hypothetical protein [unclassified Crossiella]MCK2240456.1 hypothetical protein [Crossiella sp. S99.2]MCK2253093.1 hypothetical protein [Crossiella sp. S99.1]